MAGRERQVTETQKDRDWREKRGAETQQESDLKRKPRRQGCEGAKNA